MTRIILVRHGQSEGNVKHLFAAHSDVPLTALGRKQAEAVASYIAAHEKIDAVYASNLSRAADTVTPAAERFGLSVVRTPALREIRAGRWENQPYSELRTNPDYVEDYWCWGHDIPRARCTGGESVAEMYDRIVAEVLRIAAENEGKTVLIGTHWTPVLAVIAYAQRGSIEGMAEEDLNPLNAALHTFRYENGKLTLDELNITSHLKNLESEPYKA